MIARVWIRVRLAIAIALIDLLKARAIKLHQKARNEDDPAKSLALRLTADDCDEDAEDIKATLEQRERK